jgi:Rod binding domain-containing protein
MTSRISNLTTSPLPPVRSTGLSPNLSVPASKPAAISSRGAKAARDFEAQLIGSLLQSMEKTFATLPGEKTLAGADDYNAIATDALSQALAARGGFGIAAMISRHLTAHEGKGSTAGRPEAKQSEER